MSDSSPYQSYAYGYPHKTAYRPLDPPVPLGEAWAAEDRSALFLYVHVPFCEQRCGFCNLYTLAQPRPELPDRYLDALGRQARVVADALGAFRVARVAVGGGTPTLLGAARLARLLGLVEGLGGRGAPMSVEVSPETLDAEQLALLRDFGVSRVSVGVQSVLPAETAAASRRQERAAVERAITTVAKAIPTCNVDLIVGLPGQTEASLRASLDTVIALGANELYLYPLYVRPLTGLERRGAPEDRRFDLHRAGREALLARGWVQHSLRMFRAPDAPDPDGPPYRCEADGMIGLGAGARSYTRTLHYAHPWTVSQGAIRAGIEAWIAQSDADFGLIRHGFRLDAEEERRRLALLTLLDQGVDLAAWRARFGGSPAEDLPELGELVAEGLATWTPERLRLSAAGVEQADVIGAQLQSPRVRALRAAWELR